MLYATDESPMSTEQLLQQLFEGIDSQTEVKLHVHRILDLESYLEGYPALEEKYISLSSEDRDALVDLIDECNEKIAEALSQMDDEEDDQDEDHQESSDTP